VENAVSVQTLEFFCSALLGLGLGVFYDLLRTVRAFLPKKRAFTAFVDALFWICSIFALLAFVLTFAGGRMRWYILFGAFCGGFVYRTAASEIVFRLILGTVNAFIKIMHTASRPVYRLLSRLARWGRKNGRSVYRASRKHLGNMKGKADKNGSKKKKKEKHIP